MRKDLALGTATALSIVASSMAPLPAWAADGTDGIQQETAPVSGTAEDSSAQSAETATDAAPDQQQADNPMPVVAGVGIAAVVVGTGIGVVKAVQSREARRRQAALQEELELYGPYASHRDFKLYVELYGPPPVEPKHD